MGFFKAMEKPGQAPDVRLGPQGEASQACSLQLLGGVQPHSVRPLCGVSTDVRSSRAVENPRE